MQPDLQPYKQRYKKK